MHSDVEQIKISYSLAPYSFKISRSSTGKVLFTIAHYPLIEPRYLRLKDDASTHGIPRGANLYDNHPAYFEHRLYGGTHDVRFLLLSSSGMGMKVCGDGESVTSLEYSVIGSMFDF